MTSPQNVRFRDFTEENDNIPVKFKIGDKEYVAPAMIPAGVLQDLVSLAKSDTGLDMSKVASFFDLLLDEASAIAFRDRLFDKVNPIGIHHINKIIPWLLEVYGFSPTLAPSQSSDGSPTEIDGASLMDGAQAIESSL